jgi:histidyl-tRNA synthetase
MARSVTPPRGMRDFLPLEKARREQVLGVIRRVYASRGFDEIETPVMEDAARLHAGLGGDNEKLAFGVLKRGLTEEDLHAASDPLDLTDLGLRFDLTVPLTRFYATHRAELPAVFRAVQIAPVWRAERPQRGRYRQFVQCDIDIIGEAGPVAEVELVSATAAALRELGLDGCSIRINDRRLLTGMLSALGFAAADHPSVLITVDKLDKVGPDGVIAELRERDVDGRAVDALRDFLGTTTTVAPSFDAGAIASALPDGVDPALVTALADLGAAVLAADPTVEVVFDPFLVRGMGYYTGTIFEIQHPDFPGALGGGGRYDGMVGRLLGVEVPAAGFSIGFERILELLPTPDPSEADALALVYDPGVPPARLVALQAELVATGMRVRLERRPRNMKPLLEQLSAAGYSRTASVTDRTAHAADLDIRPLR